MLLFIQYFLHQEYNDTQTKFTHLNIINKISLLIYTPSKLYILISYRLSQPFQHLQILYIQNYKISTAHFPFINTNIHKRLSYRPQREYITQHPI